MRQRVLLAADQFAILSLPRPKPQPDRVLLVRMDNIGDFVVWLDAAVALVTFYRAQGKRVTLLANRTWKSWAEETGLFDEVIAIDEKRFCHDLRYRLHLGRQIRDVGFGTAIQPAYTRLLEGGDAVVRLSGATERIGQYGVFDHGMQHNRKRGNGWYTRLLRVDPQLSGEMERNGAFVRALTGAPYKAKVANLRDHLELDLPMELGTALRGRPFYVLFPGATFAGRLWPAERYIELAKRLYEATGFTGVICGGPSEQVQAAAIAAGSTVPMLDWVGRTSLTGLAAVLAHARLLVANETSAVHIGAAVGTPTVCILGGGHFGRFMPYRVEMTDGRPLPVAAVHRMGCFGCDWRCVYHPPKGTPVPCIEEVSIAEAWLAVERALAHGGTGRRAVSALAPVPALTVLECC